MKYNKFKMEVEERILPFWLSLYDDEYGGLFGRVDFDYNIIKNSDKGCIFISRVLWFFSNALIEGIGDKEDIRFKADSTYNFLLNHCIDKLNGGVFWSVSRNGIVSDSTKHTYNIAFAIYALSSYYKATGDKKSLDKAFELFNLIESKCKDGKGYLESFSVDFKPLINDKLSENGIIADRTMNTILHLIEGFSGLYEISHSKQVKESIIGIFDIFDKYIYNKDKKRQEVFFDLDYNSLIDLHSFGHDIETSWLMGWSLDLINDENLTRRIDPLLRDLLINVLNNAISEKGGLFSECEKGIINNNYVWWVQCESVVGFYNAYEKWNIKGSKQAASSIFDFINEYFIDKRIGGEWFWELDNNCKPTNEKDLVEQWKCPYHNGRMCFEMMRRLKND